MVPSDYYYFSTNVSINYRLFLGSTIPRVVSLYHLYISFSLLRYLLFVEHFLSKCLANQFSKRRCFAFGQKLSVPRCDLWPKVTHLFRALCLSAKFRLKAMESNFVSLVSLLPYVSLTSTTSVLIWCDSPTLAA